MKNVVPAFLLATLVTVTTAGTAHADEYNLDPVHTTALFKIKHLGVSNFNGRFNDISGNVTVNGGAPSALNVVIKTASVDTFNKKRDTHLRSPDFFNAKQFPKITFKSTSIKKKSASTYTVTGKLTIHGVTKTVTADLVKVGEGKDPWGGQRIGFDAEFNVSRSDFGITFMREGLGDQVRVTFSLEGIKK